MTGGNGCLYVLVCAAMLAALLLGGGGYLLDKLAEVRQADAAVETQQTIQQRDYYAYLAAMVAMGQAADDVPWFVWLLGALDAGLLGYLAYTKRARG